MKEVLIAVLGSGGLAALVYSIRDIWIKYLEKKRPNNFTKLIPKINETYSCLNTIVSESDAKRAILLKTTNGGGQPVLHKPIYSTIMFESFDAPLKSIRHKWKQQLIDEPYIKILAKLLNEGEIIIYTNDLEGGMLKTFYTAQGIFKSKVFKINENSNRFVYLSINYTEEVKETVQQKDLTRAMINNLRNIFRESLKK